MVEIIIRSNLIKKHLDYDDNKKRFINNLEFIELNGTKTTITIISKKKLNL